MVSSSEEREKRAPPWLHAARGAARPAPLRAVPPTKGRSVIFQCLWGPSAAPGPKGAPRGFRRLTSFTSHRPKRPQVHSVGSGDQGFPRCSRVRPPPRTTILCVRPAGSFASTSQACGGSDNEGRPPGFTTAQSAGPAHSLGLSPAPREASCSASRSSGVRPDPGAWGARPRPPMSLPPGAHLSRQSGDHLGRRPPALLVSTFRISHSPPSVSGDSSGSSAPEVTPRPSTAPGRHVSASTPDPV
ncbi:hypothetical protein NDU88_009561 [Pleurodeles waltl]|uniref:Uncharacterized protein n=1 Tax=Pleurodeles waltl TaxID=8319 RepID=A0AAV7S022_PLEWA|nr:hypothetical protein NDU88_009561 [Pleurodeles waltl]